MPIPINVVENTIVIIWNVLNQNFVATKPHNIPKIMLNAIGNNNFKFLKYLYVKNIIIKIDKIQIIFISVVERTLV